MTPRGWGVDIPKRVGLSTDRVLVGFNCGKAETIADDIQPKSKFDPGWLKVEERQRPLLTPAFHFA